MPDSDQTLSRNNTDVMDLREIKGVRFINNNKGRFYGTNKITNSYTDSDPYSSIAGIADSYSDFTGFDGFILSDGSVVKFNGLVVSELCPDECYGRYIGYYIQNTKDKESKKLIDLPLYTDDKGTPYALYSSSYSEYKTQQTFQDMLYGLYNSEGSRGHYDLRFSAHNDHNKIYERREIIPGIGSGSDEYERHKLRMRQIALGVYLRGKFINIKNPLLQPVESSTVVGGSRRGYSYKYKKYVKNIIPSKSKRRAKSRKTRRQRK